jgi:4-hydroxythreonine-4-phosphate dehydrogenase
MSLKIILTSKSRRIRAGITIGDPSGIGPAITVKALTRLRGLADFTVIGDLSVLRRVPGFKSLNKSGIKFTDPGFLGSKGFSFGNIAAEYGRASVLYLEKALELSGSGEIDCLITCPISKEAVNKAGFNFSGHTEFFSAKTGSHNTVMMLLNDRLKFSLVTRHISIKEVPRALSKDKIRNTALATHAALRKIFGFSLSRIAVCALNPHASDNGLLGGEENAVISPAVKSLSKDIPGICGPLPADSAISRALKGDFDALVAMYHDQALIPLKITGAQSGVNMTLGLPFIRTSPLHGTAFDIAKNPFLAEPASLISAIKLAVKCASSLRKT